MAKQIPNLPSTSTLSTTDETILRQGSFDKRISLQLAGTLSWASRNGYSFIGEHLNGMIFNNSTSFSTYLDKTYFVKGGVPLPYTSLSSDPSVDTNLYIKGESSILDDMFTLLVGFILPDSTMQVSPDRVFLADGAEYNRADYPKLWNKVNGTAMLVSQSLINADPETYAANYGDGDGATTFTLPNYGLRPHLAASGVFGVVGSTVEDHIQNITGSIESFHATTGSAGRATGVFSGAKTTGSTAAAGSNGDVVTFDIDASLSVRTGTYTEVSSSFLNFYIIHGESA